MTRMRHSKHGFTDTGDGVTVEDLQKHGWVVDTPKPKAEEKPIEFKSFKSKK